MGKQSREREALRGVRKILQSRADIDARMRDVESKRDAMLTDTCTALLELARAVKRREPPSDADLDVIISSCEAALAAFERSRTR